MSDVELWLDPARAHRGGADLGHAGKAISGLRDGLGAEIAAASAGRPWGKDDIGSAFEKNYRQFETMFLEYWRGLGQYVEGLGTNAVQAVNASVDTDAAAAGRIGRTRR